MGLSSSVPRPRPCMPFRIEVEFLFCCLESSTRVSSSSRLGLRESVLDWDRFRSNRSAPSVYPWELSISLDSIDRLRRSPPLKHKVT